MSKKLGFAGAATLLAVAVAVAADAPKKGDVAKGKAVFAQCVMCHAVDGTTKKMGPNLKGLYKQAKLKNGKAVNDADVEDVIKKGGKGMPAFGEMLSAQELQDLVAYLHIV